MAESIYEELYKEELYVLPGLTVVVVDKDWGDLSENDTTLLSKIISSVKLTLASVQIVNRSSLSVADIHNLGTKSIISFGVPVDTISQKYECIELSGVPVIVSDSISALDDARKKSLWGALRKMFGI